MTDEEHEKKCERRDEVSRRLCELMGWPYGTGLVWLGLRKIALAEATAVSVDKLEEIVKRLEATR